MATSHGNDCARRSSAISVGFFGVIQRERASLAARERLLRRPVKPSKSSDASHAALSLRAARPMRQAQPDDSAGVGLVAA
jgi:hypothetical protein